MQITTQFLESFQKGLGSNVNMRNTFHPRTDDQAKCEIQTSEDILRLYVIDFKGNFDDYLPMIEFACNDYHSTIYMSP